MNIRKSLAVIAAFCGLALTALMPNVASCAATWHRGPSDNISYYYQVVSANPSSGYVAEQYDPDGSMIRFVYEKADLGSVKSVTLFAPDGSQAATWQKGQPLDAASAKVVSVEQQNGYLKITFNPGYSRQYQVQYNQVYALGWQFSSHVIMHDGRYELGMTSYTNSFTICALARTYNATQESDTVARPDGTIKYVEEVYAPTPQEVAHGKSGTHVVTVRDSTGTMPLYTQLWENSELTALLEMDSTGGTRRSLQLESNPPAGTPYIVVGEIDMDVTLSGVTYYQVEYDYRKDGSLEQAVYYDKESHVARQVSFPQAAQIKGFVPDVELAHP